MSKQICPICSEHSDNWIKVDGKTKGVEVSNFDNLICPTCADSNINENYFECTMCGKLHPNNERSADTLIETVKNGITTFYYSVCVKCFDDKIKNN